jgi:hypothetical protein
MTILALMGGGAGGAGGGGAGAIGEVAKMVGEIVKAMSKQQNNQGKDGGNKIAGEDTHSHNGQMQFGSPPQSMNININSNS